MPNNLIPDRKIQLIMNVKPGKQTILNSGVPQGFTLAPVLSTLLIYPQQLQVNIPTTYGLVFAPKTWISSDSRGHIEKRYRNITSVL